MNIIITTRKCTVRSDEKDYIEEKLGALKKLTEKEGTVHVVVSKDRHGLYKMDVNVRGPLGEYYATESDVETVMAAIDMIQAELKKQLQKNHKKKIDLSRRRARSVKKALTIDEKARF